MKSGGKSGVNPASLAGMMEHRNTSNQLVPVVTLSAALVAAVGTIILCFAWFSREEPGPTIVEVPASIPAPTVPQTDADVLEPAQAGALQSAEAESIRELEERLAKQTQILEVARTVAQDLNVKLGQAEQENARLRQLLKEGGEGSEF